MAFHCQLLNSSNVLTLPAPPASLDELTQLLRLHHGASFRSAEQEVRYFPSSVPHPHFRARGFIQSLSGLPETSEDAPLIAVPNPWFFGELDTKLPPEPKVFHRLERALQPSEYRLSASGELAVPLPPDQMYGPSFFVCDSSSAAAKYAHKRAGKKDTCQCSTNPLEGPPTDAGVEMILEKRWPASQVQWSKSGLAPDQIGGWHYVAAPMRPPGCPVAVLEAVARREYGEWFPCNFAASAEPAEDLLNRCRTSKGAVAVQALEYIVADEERDPAERFVAAILQYHAAVAEAPEVALFHSTALELLYDGADLLLTHQGESMEFWDLQEFLDDLSARATYWNPCSPDQEITAHIPEYYVEPLAASEDCTSVLLLLDSVTNEPTRREETNAGEKKSAKPKYCSSDGQRFFLRALATINAAGLARVLPKLHSDSDTSRPNYEDIADELRQMLRTAGPPAWPAFHEWLGHRNAAISVHFASTLCQLQHLPAYMAPTIAKELCSDPLRLATVVQFLNQAAPTHGQLIGVAVQRDVPLQESQRLPPPEFSSPFFVQLFQLRQATPRGGNQLAMALFKWLRVLRQNAWRIFRSFLFLFVHDSQPLHLRRLYERQESDSYGERNLVERDDTVAWIRAVEPQLRAILPPDFVVAQGFAHVPRGTSGWFLVAWDRELLALATPEVLRFCRRLGLFPVSRYLGKIGTHRMSAPD